MKTVIVLALIGAAFAGDLNLGSTGTKVFEEHVTANPAIWRQSRRVSIASNTTDVISRIAVNDLRPEKDGDVSIVEGGLGKTNLTLELKSPTVFRGFDFQIEVYAVPENEYVLETNQSATNKSTEQQTSDKPDGSQINTNESSTTPNTLNNDTQTAEKDVPAITGQDQLSLPAKDQPMSTASAGDETKTNSDASITNQKDETKVTEVGLNNPSVVASEVDSKQAEIPPVSTTEALKL